MQKAKYTRDDLKTMHKFQSIEKAHPKHPKQRECCMEQIYKWRKG